MIAELVGGLSISRADVINDNEPKDALPRTRYSDSKRSDQGSGEGKEGHTFPMDP